MISKIKKLDKKFVREVMNLHKKSIFPLWRKLKRDYSIKEVREYIVGVFEKGKVFGYFENKTLIGCGGIILEKNHGVGDVCLVLVYPEHQRKGIGREIMKKIEDYSKTKVKKLRLNVLIKNKAVKFYEKLGYKKGAYVMEKKLK